MNQHRLIVGKNVIEEDTESLRIYPDEYKKEYSLIYQMTHITKDKGCLAHDDRLDSLEIAVKECLTLLSADAEKLQREREEEEFERELAKYWDFEIKNPNWFNL